MNTPETQVLEIETDIVSGGVKFNRNLERYIQESVDDRFGRQRMSTMTENTAFVMYPPILAPSCIVLNLDKNRIMQELEKVRFVEAEGEWPHDLGQAMTVASSDMLAVIWDTLEEDEAWRDL